MSDTGESSATRASLRIEPPALRVDADGRILALEGSAGDWLGAGAIGVLLTDRLAPADTLQAAIDNRMAGIDETAWAVPDGRRVVVRAVPADDGWWLTLHDVSALMVMNEARAERLRMEAMGSLATALARELNDPMSIVQGRLELLMELGVTDVSSVTHHQQVALDHARRISTTLRNLRLVGSSTTRRIQRVEVAAMIDEALTFLGRRRERVQVDVQPPDLAAGGLPPMYTRVMANTLRQTIEGSARGPVYVEARRRDGRVRVRVDLGRRGRGEPLEGADLSIDQTLLRSVGAELVAERVGRAPVFELWFPLPPATRERPRPVGASLLVVGDEAFDDAVRGLLAKDGYAFHWVASGDEALQEGPFEHQGVVVDLLLEGPVSGLAVARQVRSLTEDCPVVLVSDGPLPHLPDGLRRVGRPLARADLLDALGRRVRRA